MCTWFYVESKPLSQYIDKAKTSPLANDIMVDLGKSISMDGDIRPTDVAAVIAPARNGGVGVFPMVWGFTHEATNKPIINCRIETAETRPMWKESWQSRRCVIPASWYYEWGVSETDEVNNSKLKKAKYAIQPTGADVTFLAGVYRYEEHRGKQIPMFSVITREASESIRIHDRMPLILKQEDVVNWICAATPPKDISKKSLTDMIVEPVNDCTAADFVKRLI